MRPDDTPPDKIANLAPATATAVFTNTIVARKVLDMFSRWKMARTPYHGVSVTFSSDPCEKELVLVKETTRSHAAKSLMKRPLR